MIPEKPVSFYTGKGYLRPGIFDFYKILYEEIASLLPPPDECPNIIDLGCGVGYFAKILSSMGYKNYIGIDFSEKILKHAKRITPQYKYELGNLHSKKIRGIILKNKLFIAIETLEHITEDIKVLKSLPKGSLIIGSVPAKLSAGHVRCFKGVSDVFQRYHSLIEFNFIKTIIMKPKLNVVTIFRGRRK